MFVHACFIFMDIPEELMHLLFLQARSNQAHTIDNNSQWLHPAAYV